MKDYKIIIDASHGGNDSGVIGNNLIEKDFALLISNYIYNRLKTLGYDVAMTRSTDETLSNEDRIERALGPFGSGNNVIIISNHLTKGEGNGVQIVYALRNNNYLPNNIKDALEENDIKVQKVFQRRLPSDTSKDYYFIQRDTKNTIPISIYYGDVDTDASNLNNNYKIYGDSVVDGILSFTNYNPVNEDNTYIVKTGDSLWSIAKKFSVSVEDLKRVNNLSGNLLSIGQKLIIPSTDVPPQTGDFIIYTVSSGDTLYGIARKYNLSVNDIIDYNDLSSTNLEIGKQLLIPVVKENNNTYIVKSGDTLYTIANRYGISINELKEYNNLTSNNLSIGQRLSIPPKEEINNTTLYVVKPGDSLYSIANKYNTTVSDIMKLNNLKTNLLNIGMVLKIPYASGITYTVKSGDNLYSIARKYNTTADNIKKKNNLTSNTLSIGQILII